jgi:ankyrin repeat protein
LLCWQSSYPPVGRAAGVPWLLQHGADANLSWAEFGDAPLHVAAQRWDVPMIELLVHHGADIHQRRADGRTAHTLSELYGNQEIAAWLLLHGAKDERSSLEHFVSACSRGDRVQADAVLQAHPNLRGELRAEHHLMMQVPAERGDAKVLETMLAHGASVNALDGMFSATPLVWAAEGWSHGSDTGTDYPSVARLLIAAGSSLEWMPPEKAPDPERTQEQLIELCRAAAL